MNGKKPPRGRRVTSDEQKLWEYVSKDIAPLKQDIIKPNNEASPENKENISTPEIPSAAPYAPRKYSKSIQKDIQAPLPQTAASFATPDNASSRQLDGRTAQRLKKGRIPIEDSIDLHGMNQAEAHALLSQFIKKAAALKYRCVLVITGKGKSKATTQDAPKGILRQRLPEWLALEPLNSLVLRIETSRQRHGGEGAFYIYLRRQKDPV